MISVSVISEIKQPIKQEMIAFEKEFKNSLKSKVPLLDRIILHNKKKRAAK